MEVKTLEYLISPLGVHLKKILRLSDTTHGRLHRDYGWALEAGNDDLRISMFYSIALQETLAYVDQVEKHLHEIREIVAEHQKALAESEKVDSDSSIDEEPTGDSAGETDHYGKPHGVPDILWNNKNRRPAGMPPAVLGLFSTAMELLKDGKSDFTLIDVLQRRWGTDWDAINIQIGMEFGVFGDATPDYVLQLPDDVLEVFRRAIKVVDAAIVHKKAERSKQLSQFISQWDLDNNAGKQLWEKFVLLMIDWGFSLPDNTENT